MKFMKTGSIQQLTGLFSLLTLLILFSACGNNSTSSNGTVSPAATAPTAAPATPTPLPTTPASTTASPTASDVTGFTPFKGNGFTLTYPASWTHKTDGNYEQFMAADGVSMFEVSLHNTDKTPCASQPVCNQGDVDGRSHATSVIMNGLTWQQSDWWYYLSNEYYVVRRLTATDPQTKNTITIIYGDYSQVFSAKLINFDQASKTYFQPMAQSFRLQ